MPATVWTMKEALSTTSIRTDIPLNGFVKIFVEKSRRVRLCKPWKKETGECPETAWERLQEYSFVRKCTEEGAEGNGSAPGLGIFPEEKELYELLKNGLEMGNVKPESIDLGTNQDGSMKITLADILDEDKFLREGI